MILQEIHKIVSSNPEITLFLSLCLGFLLGKINFGKFQLGGVAGSLFVAVIISQIGVQVNDTVKNVLFALFIYAIGYTSGPIFFRSLGKKSLKEIAMAASMALSALITITIVARVFHFDKGLAAGVAAGGLTQSAIMGTAESAINALNLPVKETAELVTNISVGYGVTYIFGSFGAIFMCTAVLEKFLNKNLRDEAIKAEIEMQGGKSAKNNLPEVIGREFFVGKTAGKTIKDFEQSIQGGIITVESLKRDNTIIDFNPNTLLEENDKIYIIGQREIILKAEELLGEEQPIDNDMKVPIKTENIVISHKEFVGRNVSELNSNPENNIRHGVYFLSILRKGAQLPIDENTKFEKGDVVAVYGTESDIKKFSSAAGYAIVKNDKTDFVILGLGLVIGLLIGQIVIKAKFIPITLGSGGGSLLSGLFFGWFRTRKPNLGALSNSTAQFMKDIGLAGFVSVVGLNYGKQALLTIEQKGISIFIAGVIVTLVPILITMIIAKYVIKYDNAAVLAGALSGSRSANPAFGAVLDKAGNNVPTIPFAVTYALANVFLTLLGPLIVAIA